MEVFQGVIFLNTFQVYINIRSNEKNMKVKQEVNTNNQSSTRKKKKKTQDFMWKPFRKKIMRAHGATLLYQ